MGNKSSNLRDFFLFFCECDWRKHRLQALIQTTLDASVFLLKGVFSDLIEVSHSVLLSCGEIGACLSFCSSCCRPSVKASVGVSPWMKPLVQVAPFAATCSNCECEEAVFIEQLTFRFGSADCCCHFCSCHNLGQKPELGHGWLHTSKKNLLKQK